MNSTSNSVLPDKMMVVIERLQKAVFDQFPNHNVSLGFGARFVVYEVDLKENNRTL
jgi:hypothetical protein